MQEALSRFLGSGEGRTSLRSPLEDLIHEHVFADELRRTLVEDVGVTNEELLQRALSQVRLADCPGTWLSRQVSKSLTAAESAPEAGSTYDLELLGYLPYVDILFADKRIAEYTRQVLRRDGLPEALKGARPPLAIPSTVAAIHNSLSDSDS